IDQPTEWGAGGCQAVWSPDGMSIVYQTSPDWPYDLYVFDCRTRVRRRLTYESGEYPRWTPDGARIVYYSPKRECRTFRIRPDGSADGPFPTLEDPGLRVRGFTWSPDGEQVAFVSWCRWERGDISLAPARLFVAARPYIRGTWHLCAQSR